MSHAVVGFLPSKNWPRIIIFFLAAQLGLLGFAWATLATQPLRHLLVANFVAAGLLVMGGVLHQRLRLRRFVLASLLAAVMFVSGLSAASSHALLSIGSAFASKACEEGPITGEPNGFCSTDRMEEMTAVEEGPSTADGVVAVASLVSEFAGVVVLMFSSPRRGPPSERPAPAWRRAMGAFLSALALIRVVIVSTLTLYLLYVVVLTEILSAL